MFTKNGYADTSVKPINISNMNDQKYNFHHIPSHCKIKIMFKRCNNAKEQNVKDIKQYNQ